MANDGSLIPISAIEKEDCQQPDIDETVWETDDTLTTAINEFKEISPIELQQQHGIEVTNLPRGIGLIAERSYGCTTACDTQKSSVLWSETRSKFLETGSPQIVVVHQQ